MAKTQTNAVVVEDLRPHQAAALLQLSDGKVLWSGTGSGKSKVAVEYYLAEHSHQDVYVITTAKKRDSLDWTEEFAKIAVGRDTSDRICVENDIDMVPDSAYGLLTVDSWNNIANYKDVKNAFFIFDEQRLVGKGSWVKAFLKIAKQNDWIMLTATPGDTWLDYIPIFVANGFYKNRTEFNREHVIWTPFTRFPKVQGYRREGKLLKLRNDILVHMPYPKLTVRHSKTIFVDYNDDLIQHVIKNRWHIYANRPIRDIAELAAVMRKIVNSDPSRIKKIKKLLKEHPKLIVFYNFDYELEALRGLQSVTEVAEWNGHKHEEIPQTDSWVYLVQYVAGSEAWNCIETNAIAFYSLTYSYKRWEQSHGRIDRMNTPFVDLYYYILRSTSPIDNAVWKSLKAKQNFNVNKFDILKILTPPKKED